MKKKTKKPRIFKTKLTGSARHKVVNQGRTAARNGWERKSPYINCRAEEAWYFGYDDQKNNPRTMKHCTDCGRILLASEEVCPSCEGTNIRPNIGAGTEIVMTVQGKHV